MQFSTVVNSFLALCTVLIFTGCKDKSDREPPRVTIQKPYENQTFQALDTLMVEATISDNEQLEWVVIQLLDNTFNNMSVSKSINVSGSVLQLSTDFILDAPELESGPYYLAVRASDGTNISSAYVAIGISAIPRKVEGFFAVSHASGQTRVWHQSVEGGDFEMIHHQSTDFVGAALNFRNDFFGLAPSTGADVVFFDYPDWVPVLVVPGPSPGLPFFSGMKYTPATQRTFIWKYAAEVMVFDGYLQQLNAFATRPELTPVEVFDVRDRYYVIEKQISGSIHSLCIYSQAGLLLSSAVLEGPCRLISAKDSNEDFVWLDTPDGLSLKIRNGLSGLFSSPYHRPQATLYDAVEMDTGIFALLTSDGLLTYNYGTGNTTIIASSINTPGTVAYEDISGNFFVTSASEVLRLSPTGTVLQTFPFPQNVEFFAVDYTR